LIDGYNTATSLTCLDCHAVGAEGATRIPHDPNETCGGDGEECWDGRRDCLGCHRYDPALGGPTEPQFPPGGAIARAPTGGNALSSQQLTVAGGLVEGNG
jgi:hypothetical protein